MSSTWLDLDWQYHFELRPIVCGMALCQLAMVSFVFVSSGCCGRGSLLLARVQIVRACMETRVDVKQLLAYSPNCGLNFTRTRTIAK